MIELALIIVGLFILIFALLPVVAWAAANIISIPFRLLGLPFALASERSSLKADLALIAKLTKEAAENPTAFRRYYDLETAIERAVSSDWATRKQKVQLHDLHRAIREASKA